MAKPIDTARLVKKQLSVECLPYDLQLHEMTISMHGSPQGKYVIRTLRKEERLGFAAFFKKTATNMPLMRGNLFHHYSYAKY